MHFCLYFYKVVVVVSFKGSFLLALTKCKNSQKSDLKMRVEISANNAIQN